MKKIASLRLGPEVVRHLLPHRRPLLLVDRVTAYERTPQPTLLACRYITANEDVFAGHLPELAIWPGVYICEGLGQTSYLLHLIWMLQQGFEDHGRSADEVLEALRDLEHGARIQPGQTPSQGKGAALLEVMQRAAIPVGLAAGVEMKFLQPVFPGSRLDYRLVQTHLTDSIVRFEAEAEVEGQLVARGVLHSTRGVPILAGRRGG